MRLRKARPAIAWGTAAVLALSLSACGSSGGGDDTAAVTEETAGSTEQSPVVQSPEAAQSPEEEQSPTTDADTVVDGPIDPARAAEIALERVPGTVVGIEAERKRNAEIWEVIVRGEDGSGTELYIDRTTGEILDQSSERLSRAQRETPAISVVDALDIAFSAVPGTLIEIDLDTERSTLQWEVEIQADAGGRFEIYIDATTGDILKQEQDD